jgi:hypothetical protein
MSHGFLIRVIFKTIGGAAKTEEWLAHVPDRFTVLDAVEKRTGGGSFAQMIDQVPYATGKRLSFRLDRVSIERRHNFDKPPIF